MKLTKEKNTTRQTQAAFKMRRQDNIEQLAKNANIRIEKATQYLC